MGRWPAEWPRTVHLIGVGGVAMSGLAALLNRAGSLVRGSDQAIYPPASTMLASAGIEVRSPYSAENLDHRVDLVVVGNAISRGNPELERALDLRLPIASMAEVIERLLIPGKRVTAIAGTHGKTTTSSMVAYLLHAAGLDPSFLIGGQPGNFEIGAHWGKGQDLVLEADEYDSAFFDKGPKFLHYWPQVAVLGPVEFDHADIYADQQAVERAFSLFLRLVPSSGTLVVHDHPTSLKLADAVACEKIVVGGSAAARLGWRDRVDRSGGQRFVLTDSGRDCCELRLALAGEHNAKNALAAMAAAGACGVPPERAASLLAGFIGPRRRLELLAEARGVRLFDDFAHHPTAIEATLATLRQLAAGSGRLIACLEPRSNTMARPVFFPRLIEALRGADRLFVAGIDRPERFKPGEGLDVARLCAELRAVGCSATGPLSAEEVESSVLAELQSGDLVVVMTNGAFGGLSTRLKEQLLARASAD